MNLKRFIALILALIVGLVGGWFLGFGVTNKELDVDWKSITPIFSALIASSIAAATALYISNKWSGQKGVEVIADEAKEAIKASLGLIHSLIHIHQRKQCSEEKFIEISESAKSILAGALYVERCIDDGELTKVIRIFAKSSGRANNHLNRASKCGGELNDEVLGLVEDTYTHGLMNLITVLEPYSVYTKKFNLI